MKGRFHPTGRANLFAAFHHLRGANQEVSLSKWTSFWCKKPQRYEVVAAMKETKHARPESTHNPSGGLPDTTRWSHVEERMFSGHGVRDDKRDETYLAAFLSCWLCAFLLPNKDGEFVHPGTFKMASLMESGRKISLAILVLANIYNRLNKISTLSPLHQIKVCFPTHYVYGWFDHYLKTHYAFSIGPFIPTMVIYSGEGGSRYFDSNDERKCIHGGENVAWTSTMLHKTYPYFHVDNNHAPELESSYFMSIHSNYLPLRCRYSFIIEPYCPHRFSRQFVFYQNIPDIIKNDICSASLDKGLTFWRIYTMSGSASRATFPSITPNAGKSFGSDYQASWKKMHGKFLDDHLQALVDVARPIPIVHLEGSREVCNNKVLNTGMPSSLGVKVHQKNKIKY
ncbi:hypothetical protein KY289_030627 [Solanum tuberosum]|nr:hypothetical protein KY289_030627 [Solanum tuberosum]